MRLLTLGNPKTSKGVARKYLTAVLHLAPHWLSGFNVCARATAGCSAACLAFAGRAAIFAGRSIVSFTGAEVRDAIASGTLTNRIQEARIRKTRQYFEDRPTFMRNLVSDIFATVRKAERAGLTPAIRLNGTSDIMWENVPVNVPFTFRQKTVHIVARNIFEAFPTVQFYDYTKHTNRQDLPANYHLTFSLAEDNDEAARVALDNGLNVATVFRRDLPDVFMGVPVVNGDETDLRFLDPRGVIVGLKAKGKAKIDTSGFVRDA